MIKKTPLVMIFVFSITAVSCAFEPKPDPVVNVDYGSYLEDFINKRNYFLFDIPRDSLGVGTVVNFKEKSENIVWGNEQCLNFLTDSGDVLTPDVTLGSNNYNIKNISGIEGSLAKGLSERIDISGAFNDERVASIEISVVSPREHIVPHGLIKRRIASLVERGDECVKDLFAQDNYIIDRVLEVNGFTYKFKNERNSSLDIDSEILTAVNLDSDTGRNYMGEQKIEETESRFVGYRVYRATISAGFTASSIAVNRVSNQELERMKKFSTQ